MATAKPQSGIGGPPMGARVAPTLAGGLVRRLGGRFSTAMGIDPEAGAAQVERWFLAATLFGTRIAAPVAERTFAVLEASGIHRIADVAARDDDDLVALLDAGGYARYDVRTLARLRSLEREVAARYGGDVSEIGRRFADPQALEAALDDLPGWGRVTVGLFLRELRGVWPGARPALDARAAQAGLHVGLLHVGLPGSEDQLDRLCLVSRLARCDERDLEAALVRLALAHGRFPRCPGGRDCVVVGRAPPLSSPTARRVALPGGRAVSIRPMRREDGPALVALYAALDEEDVYRRFFGGRPPPQEFVVKMAAVAERGGAGLVATISGPRRGDEATTGGEGSPETVVAEATYDLLTNGDGELGITVAAEARGWLGPFLLDALLEEAAARGVPNLQADVLMTNAQMLAMLRRRGIAIIGYENQPAVLRVVVGTVGRVPSWPTTREQHRVVIEAPGGRFRADAAARAAGFCVMGCPGPPGGWAACPPMWGEPCPLAAEGDVIVDALPAGPAGSLLDAHHRVHPSVPVCVELAPGDRCPASGAVGIPRGASAPEVVGMLERLVGPTVTRRADGTSQIAQPP